MKPKVYHVTSTKYPPKRIDEDTEAVFDKETRIAVCGYIARVGKRLKDDSSIGFLDNAVDKFPEMDTDDNICTTTYVK